MSDQIDGNLLSVLSEQSLELRLTPAETLQVQSKLWDLLTGRAESFTMGGSSSVRVETAQELLKSAWFVLRHGVGNDSANLRAQLLDGDYDALFSAGLKAVEKLVEDGRTLLDAALRTAVKIDNGAYRETLRELGVFFKRYHVHHFAHDIPCMLDYPLAHPVDEALQGIDYVNEYLTRLILENDFLDRFAPGTVTALLKSASPDYKDDLLSIYETVAANALALTLLGGDIRALDVTAEDRRRLGALIADWTDEAAPLKLRAASSGLCTILDIDGEPAKEYLGQTASELHVRLKPALASGSLERVFPSLYRAKAAPVQKDAYVDNPPMDDERLRALIDEITSCRHVSDKIVLVQRTVFSLRDLAEILGICFWDDEQDAMFDMLGDDALVVLRHFAERRRSTYPDWRSETGWEERLDAYRRNQG